MKVYKVTNRMNGKMYIGITKDTAERRWVVHCYEAGRNSLNCAIHRAIRKYTPDMFIVEEIASAKTWKKLCELEKYFIKFYGTFKSGYNMTKGGEGKYGYETSDETKRKIGMKSKGRKFDTASRKKMSNSQKAVYAEGRRPRTITKSQRKAVVNSNRRRCKAVLIDGVVYPSIKVAKEACGASRTWSLIRSGEAKYV